MAAQILEEKMESLNNRLRILILQNARQTSGYEKAFLFQIRGLADQILNLQTELELNAADKNQHFSRRLAVNS